MYGFLRVMAATPQIKVADCEYNAMSIVSLAKKGAEAGARVMVFPELCVTGYTCGDLFLQSTLFQGAVYALFDIARETADINAVIFVGLPLMCEGKLYNCAAAVCGGEVLGFVPKRNIPNYGEFYELRHFTPANGESGTVEIDGEEFPFGELLFECEGIAGLKIGAEICEDLWVANPPSVAMAAAGATLIVNLSASDETIGKADYRRSLVKMQSARLLCAYAYADAGEGESTGDMVFSGQNLIAENGALLAQVKPFEGEAAIADIDLELLEAERRRMNTFESGNGGYLTTCFDLEENSDIKRSIPKRPFVPEDKAGRDARCEEILAMQVSGLKKRVSHTGCKKLVVGISGGLDSTLALIVSARAMEALSRSKKDIIAVTMPCFGTTKRTRGNAETLIECLGAEFREVNITKSVERHFEDIGHSMDDKDVVFENSQARERTQVLMDIANGCGGLVVGTGDLSELALGWATYNGDHMSMYGVNASIPKTLVRHIVSYAADTSDEKTAAVLRDILATPVSPELLPAENGEIAQKTEDIVGPYDLHDFFLFYMIRYGFAPKKLYEMAMHAFDGEYSAETVKKWLKIFYRRFFSQQFKRSCLPDGPKVGSVTLSPRGDWRMPSDACGALWQREIDEI